ncbi:MAG: hypothetical protein LQ350_002613 [Teloschistes chrysophthalmus]|nr:MAG: hypothetical protein LQ350_002613 [Niorma chrysophthalma]
MHPSSFLSVLAILLPLASARPADPLAPRFAPGWCTFHITQHQRNEKDVNSGNDYHYDLRILDSAQAEIGRTIGLAIPDLEARSVTSDLPFTIDITSGLIDKDPITFHYAGQHWTTADGQCKIGKFDGGARDGDCGFTC